MEGEGFAPQTAITEEEIQRYLFLLSQLISTDDKVRSEAEAEMIAMGQADILRAVFIFSEIILKDGIDFQLVILSLAWIRKIFTPDQNTTEELIATKWLEVDKASRDKVKMAIIRGLMFPDQGIVQSTSLAFTALLNIEKMQMFDMIPKLYQIYESPEYSTLTKAGVINVLAEISSKNSLGGHAETEEVQTILVDIFQKISSYFANCLRESLDIRFNIARAIDTFLDVAEILFQSDETVTSLIDIVLENLSNVPQVQEQNSFTQPELFHSTLLSILLKIIKLHYTNEEFSPDKIFDFITDKILEYKDPSIDQNMISNYLMFWTSLADFERQIIKRNFYKEKIINANQKYKKVNYQPEKEIFKNYCSTAVSKLTDKLLSIMLLIDPKDPDAEDVSIKMPHMFATCCLQSLFKLNPIDIFTKIRQYWQTDMNIYYQTICQKQKENPGSNFIIQPLNWINDHMLLLTISIFCRKTVQPNILINQLLEFFNTPFNGDFIILRDYILGTCLHAFNIPKLIDSCLFALCLLFERYPSFLNQMELDIIINWTRDNMQIRDPIIFSKILQLFAVITSKNISYSITVDVKGKILECFGVFTELFLVGISRPDSITSDIYRLSYNMICNVVRFSLYSKYNITSIDNTDNISKLINQQLAILKDITQSSEDSFNYTKISSIMFFFNTIYNTDEEYNKFFVDFLNPIMESYSKLMNPNSPIFKEGLTALEIMVRCLNRNGTELLFKVNDLVNSGLSSGIPSIITGSAYIRASLYDKFISNKFDGYEELLSNFDSNYEMIIGCLKNNKFTREHYPNLLKALGLIIKACSDHIRDNIPQSIDSFINELVHFAEMPISVDKDDIEDIEYANNFYDAMFTFAISIMKCVSSENTLSTNRKFMKLLMDVITPQYFKNLEYHFSDNSLNAFFDFLLQFVKTFGRKGNIILNRKVNYQIIIHGILSKNKKVRDKAIITYDKIKSA